MFSHPLSLSYPSTVYQMFFWQISLRQIPSKQNWILACTGQNTGVTLLYLYLDSLWWQLIPFSTFRSAREDTYITGKQHITPNINNNEKESGKKTRQIREEQVRCTKKKASSSLWHGSESHSDIEEHKHFVLFSEASRESWILPSKEEGKRRITEMPLEKILHYRQGNQHLKS